MPCARCPKIPLGVRPHPGNAVEISDRNWKAFVHWQECKATGHWPNDPIVRRHARLIQGVVDSVKESRDEISDSMQGLNQQFTQKVSEFIPAADAEAITSALTSFGGDRGGRGGRRGR